MKKTVVDIINSYVKKYADYSISNKQLPKNWYYKNGVAFWTDARTAIKVSGTDTADGIADKLYLCDVPTREKTDSDPRCPNYEKLFEGIEKDRQKIDVAYLPDNINLKDKYLRFGDGWAAYMSFCQSNKMFFDTCLDKNIEYSCRAWVQSLICEINKNCNGDLLWKSPLSNMYYKCKYAGCVIEIISAQIPYDDDFRPPKYSWEYESTMQDEVENERQTNEEMAESLNDRHEEMQEQEELPDDADVYDIVFNYLIKNACIPTSNGSGGLNIDCPYQKKDIVKSLGAMWSPRYYRWYLRADRLEKAANIIKAM